MYSNVKRLGVAGALAVGLTAIAAATASAFVPAPEGCSMSHCDVRMSDVVDLEAPASVESTWFDPGAWSMSQGLGCVSNGERVACTNGDRFGSTAQPSLRVYAADGTLLWHSGKELNSWAWTSVPIMNRRGSVIMADDERIVRFAPDGTVRWSTPTPGGRPISPTRTADGTIVLATSQGPISAYDPKTGELLGTLDLTDRFGGLPGRFDTRNTPAVRGNRIYVSTEFKLLRRLPDPGNHAALFAIEFDRAAPPDERLKIAWTFEFGARSGASPLRVGRMLVFDGDRESPTAPRDPRFFGVIDRGDHPELVWQYGLGGPGVASAAQDPRGGAWVFAFGDPILRRI